MIRVTTNGTLRTYRSNLARATLAQSQAMNTVLNNGRRFNAFSDSPSLAAQSYRAHASFARNSMQQTTSTSVIKKYEAAIAATMTIDKQYTLGLEAAERAENGTYDEAALNALGKELTGVAESIVQTLNVQYDDKYVFGGTNGHEAPFSLQGGKILFRGLDIASTDPEVQAKLRNMLNETAYVDIGLGFALDENEQVIPSTAFNASISGLALLGVGTTDAKDPDGNVIKDENGKPVQVPKNMASIIAELGHIYSGPVSSVSRERSTALFGNLVNSHNEFITNRTEIDARAEFLKNNDSRLKDLGSTINEQIEAIDRTDMADALTNFIYAQYSYNAALRVGNDILSQSFLDYMR